jgi:NAD(P)-dependent dehydrogenase (short-subunit alcohol dehydrogenase family)
MGRLDGRVAIVTGAGSGNGLAIATAYARDGAAVAIGEFSEPRGEAAEAEIVRAGGRALFVPTDVRDSQAIDRLVSETVKEFGRLDVIVNNAGVLDGYATCLDTSLELFDQIMAINVRGVFLGCKRALAEMVPAGRGKIVNMASVAGLVALAGGCAYTMSKHAIVGLTRQLACEYGPRGIRINAICPGSISTSLRQNSMEILGDTAPEMSTAGVGALSPERLAQIVPLGTRGSPEDIAGAAVYLASSDSDYMNGHTLVVDGGWTAR